MVGLSDSLAVCHGSVEKLSLLIQDTANLNLAIRSLLVLRELSIRDSTDQQQQIALLNTRVLQKTKEVGLLQEINVDLEKKANRPVKHWGLGIGGGYGFANQTFGTFFGPVLTYSFVRW